MITAQTKNARSSATSNLDTLLAHNTLVQREVKLLLTILYSFNTFSCKEFHEEPVNDKIELLQI